MSILVEVVEGVAHIRIARAQVSNAIDLPTAAALGDALDAALSDPVVHALLLSGEGARFCAGGDVAAMVAAEDQTGYVERLATTLDDALQRLAAGEKPVVVAVHGAVAGAGLAVMLSCDVIVADQATRFVSAYAGVGLTPDCGLSWLLPRAVGQVRALELLLSPRVLGADEALAWGLVTEVVDGSALDRAREIAAAIARGPAEAYGQARRLVRGAAQRSRSDVGADEARTIARSISTAYAQQRLASFVGR